MKIDRNFTQNGGHRTRNDDAFDEFRIRRRFQNRQSAVDRRFDQIIRIPGRFVRKRRSDV